MSILSVLVVVLETVPAFRRPPSGRLSHVFHEYNSTNSSTPFDVLKTTVRCKALMALEIICVMFLILELSLRFFVSDNRRKFCRNVINICDFLTLLPCLGLALSIMIAVISNTGYGHSIGDALVILNIARIVRIFRVCNIVKHSTTVQIMVHALRESVYELMLLLVLLTTGSVFYASLLFYVELHLDNINNIPRASWWALVTMTTVGYGDLVPVSSGGYLVAALCAVTGIIVIALPVPVIVNNFSKYYNISQQCKILANKDNARQQKVQVNIGKPCKSNLEGQKLQNEDVKTS